MGEETTNDTVLVYRKVSNLKANWGKDIATRWKKREKMRKEQLKKAEPTKANTLANHGLTEADLVQTNDPESVVFEKYIRLARMGVHPHTGLPITDKERTQFQYAAHTKTAFDVLGLVGGAYAGQKVAANNFYRRKGKVEPIKGTKNGTTYVLDRNKDMGNPAIKKPSEPTGVGNPVDVVGKGNTGQIEPNNLSEQMAMHEVRSNPLKNATELPIKLKDTRWPFEEGWVKMQNNVTLSNGDKVSIHYVYNKKTGLFDDFKFK